ncbi:hypothetical protein CZ797_02140 [Pseudoalteromonas sp. JB197]|nr:hypothetical protein CZ797_02140 [Pseudoalteromonas sp. JB197]
MFLFVTYANYTFLKVFGKLILSNFKIKLLYSHCLAVF